MKWQGAALADLLTKDIDELILLYADSSKGSIIRAKQRYKKKLGEVMERQEKPESQGSEAKRNEEIARLFGQHGINFTAEQLSSGTPGVHVGFTKGEDGEPVPIALPNVKFDKPGETTHEVYKPVEPARISPTRRKAVKRVGKMVLLYGDGQAGWRRRIDPVTDETELIPMHNIPMHRIIQQINAEYMPETTVNLGDMADFAEFSRFEPDSDHFHKTLGMSMRYIHDFYAQLVADNPKAHHVEVDSNHAIRPRNQILRHIPALYDFVRPGEEQQGGMLTYYYLANLQKLGIDFISGYGAAEFVYGEEYGAPPVIMKHGNHSSSSPGATVRKEAAENPTVHVIRGHGHNDEQIMMTTRDGHVLIYKQFGSSCLNDGPVPGYKSAVDDQNRPVKYHNKGHQNTFGILHDHQDGTYDLDTIIVRNGIAEYRDKVYDGNEPR